MSRIEGARMRLHMQRGTHPVALNGAVIPVERRQMALRLARAVALVLVSETTEDG